jgi:hypothetical protein
VVIEEKLLDARLQFNKEIAGYIERVHGIMHAMEGMYYMHYVTKVIMYMFKLAFRKVLILK